MPLTPAQREVLEVLRAKGRPRPEYPPGFREGLRAALEEGIGPSVRALDRPLFVSKASLGFVHACEAHALAQEASPFEWSVATARGTVAHKAIELSVHRHDRPSPLELVDGAVTRLADDPDSTIGAFLAGLDVDAAAELRGTANDQVASFLELWPPLRPQWLPRTEAKLRSELCGGMVVLSGKVDLALGAPEGDRAGRLVVDLKTGGTYPGHLDDLRFYALLDTLKVGVPPFRLASYYLDGGAFCVEDVGEHTLEAALRRTIAGTTKLAELAAGMRSAAITPNPACRWCPARRDCDGAAQWEQNAAELAG